MSHEAPLQEPRPKAEAVAELDTWLGPDGRFGQVLPGFTPRAQQLELARAINKVMADHTVLVAEAGTGTGKTFAYLVPAILGKGKVLLSTGTRNLQDQLFHRDLPQLLAAMGVRRRVALLKGRANYLCHYRYNLWREQPGLLASAAAAIEEVADFARRTTDGDIDHLAATNRDPALRGLLTASADNCLGNNCPDFENCHLFEARRRAQEADLVVINHHLFFADMSLRASGYGEVVPRADCVIFDEAHLLPDIATRFLGMSAGTGQLTELVQDVQSELAVLGGDLPDLLTHLQHLQQYTRELLEVTRDWSGNQPWPPHGEKQSRPEKQADATHALARLLDSLGTLQALLDGVAERSPGLANCRDRTALLYERLEGFTAAAPGDQVQWALRQPRSLVLHQAPLDIGPLLRERLFGQGEGWIFTSATLCVDGDFSHFTNRMGLAGNDDLAVTELALGTPFDYARQALLYIPKGLPDPRDPSYTEAVVQAALPLLRASRGGALVLFTSHAALQRAARLPVWQGFGLLRQGEAPKAALLTRFQQQERAVLLATASFWQGVDLPGQALRCVIIDKLPFASPNDPLLEARIRALREAGGDPFTTLQVAEAVIQLKQGAGRLIRTSNDHGLLMIADPRLIGRGYGRRFLASLPPMPLTRDPQRATAFLAGSLPEATADRQDRAEQ